MASTAIPIQQPGLNDHPADRSRSRLAVPAAAASRAADHSPAASSTSRSTSTRRRRFTIRVGSKQHRRAGSGAVRRTPSHQRGGSTNPPRDPLSSATGPQPPTTTATTTTLPRRSSVDPPPARDPATMPRQATTTTATMTQQQLKKPNLLARLSTRLRPRSRSSPAPTTLAISTPAPMDFKQRRDSALRERGLVPPSSSSTKSPTSPTRRSNGFSIDKDKPLPTPVVDARTAARQAALRERGLLPPAVDGRDLSEQEAERDRRLAVLAPVPEKTASDADADAGPSAAQRLMAEWRARNTTAAASTVRHADPPGDSADGLPRPSKSGRSAHTSRHSTPVPVSDANQPRRTNKGLNAPPVSPDATATATSYSSTAATATRTPSSPPRNDPSSPTAVQHTSRHGSASPPPSPPKGAAPPSTPGSPRLQVPPGRTDSPTRTRSGTNATAISALTMPSLMSPTVSSESADGAMPPTPKSASHPLVPPTTGGHRKSRGSRELKGAATPVIVETPALESSDETDEFTPGALIEEAQDELGVLPKARPRHGQTLDASRQQHAPASERRGSVFASLKRSLTGGRSGSTALSLPNRQRPNSAYVNRTTPVGGGMRTSASTGHLRAPLSPTIHNRGSILVEAGAIEDEESRRCTSFEKAIIRSPELSSPTSRTTSVRMMPFNSRMRSDSASNDVPPMTVTSSSRESRGALDLTTSKSAPTPPSSTNPVKCRSLGQRTAGSSPGGRDFRASHMAAKTSDRPDSLHVEHFHRACRVRERSGDGGEGFLSYVVCHALTEIDSPRRGRQFEAEEPSRHAKPDPGPWVHGHGVTLDPNHPPDSLRSRTRGKLLAEKIGGSSCDPSWHHVVLSSSKMGWGTERKPTPSSAHAGNDHPTPFRAFLTAQASNGCLRSGPQNG
ncbi:hypothetical protein PUNSTDRAFT_125954 [Punctularia strigosozonata HHB-11173 SS5]|uniref:uncharacterized protein n=1 Tax=Punctularia strigosozonata (strain HHB-11173) TaxID=741275 RepID=UPI000441701E|nr:uncharacterized protein PUNSTDRAFT_125954 [Punctularia strigosozonata HHB-11173 SS5]EIN09999.1 hypothetical protein PUNSTDRAFT_125954 [Punctularia strigosozonata HHB-11173 SS5]